MANVVQAFLRCQSGRFISLYNSSVSDNSTTELQTGGTGLNQTASVSLGQAYPDEIITHGFVTCTAATTGSFAASFCAAWILSPQGDVLVPVQGGGSSASEMPALIKSVRLQTGMKFYVVSDTSDATATNAKVAAYTASGKCDIFTATAVADTKTAFQNVQSGATWGQSLSNENVTGVYVTFSNSNGINDDGGGNGGVYAESAQGQLKAMWPASQAKHYAWAAWQRIPVSVEQNDTLSIMWGS